MSEFKPNQSETDNDIKEGNSIACLVNILSHYDIKTHFTQNDKNANIDGRIELMTDRRVYGNITVQIKTYPKKYFGRSKYDFPISLFGYAQQCLNEVVFLFAVNSQDNISYWKHIDNSLIRKYEGKNLQKSIAIHFEDNEVVNKCNIGETVKRWKELFKKKCDLIIQTEAINQENEDLKAQIEKYQDPTFTFALGSVIKLQRFIDMYNYLLDYEYNVVKRIYFPDAWKIGIAVFEYQTKGLSYIIHKIKYGGNGLLIKEIPVGNIKSFTNSSTISRNSRVNAIEDDPDKYALSLVQGKVKELLKSKSVLFLTKEIATEYVFDFINQDGKYININQEESYELIPLKVLLEEKYPQLCERIPIVLVSRIGQIEINNFYKCIQFLVNGGIAKIDGIYPKKGKYGRTGYVSDWYSPALAFEKVKFVYKLLPSLFDEYIVNVFQKLSDTIKFFDGYDLILVNLNYIEHPQIIVQYLKLRKGNIVPPEIIITLDYDADIYRENDIYATSLFGRYFDFNKPIFYKGNQYEMTKQQGEDTLLFFGNYYIHNLLYDYLNRRFKDYFEKKN